MKHSLYWHIAYTLPEQIDQINILQATLAAMKTAFDTVYAQLPQDSGESLTVIVDGNQLPDIHGRFQLVAEPKADGRYPCVMAASILAKTERDHRMLEYHNEYPQYRYDLHKGYGTALHCSLIRQYGPSPIQRRSFKIKRSQ